MFEHPPFVFQRIFVAVVKRMNSVLLHDDFVGEGWPKYNVHCQTI